MRPFASAATFLTLIVPPVLGQTIIKNVTYNTFYDDMNNSFEGVACSDGPNGLINKHNWTVLGDADGFPDIGGVFAVEGFDSDNCGSCWELTYNVLKINILAIDTAPVGFDISLKAMNKLTGGNAEDLGRVLVNAKQVDVTSCEQAGSKSLPPTLQPTAHHG
ncbi:immunomodulatory protein [Dichomitus squalens]|uniref:Immunomodulatory protein n=1 Tax=Dichomitus squalens TaxID=114155 RepID=A0A4Q9NN97_9APHY|nr:immunomodulatory protein [Dichomitus squalens LYAD-421 SS1]EJF62755.1 immunomodulatory protein [Dichomitus squalens LYAD-421 SS1]TBU41362.1 immunomodulatory protein [Dichomitus squalens]TBU57038.1 immunomodulatory protein [Dichomitus squalens]